jgi:predicted DNA-binding transcriptional regulator YafY
MAVNKNALIRYKTIDKCLQNHYRLWTLEDLIYECSEALYEYEGIDKGVSRRTVQADIQIMRSDKLGYNAPIIVVDRKYYQYEEQDYSITNIPISDQDLGKLSEAVQFLKQFQGFSHFKELDGMVQKLEDHVYSQQTNQLPVIDFEKNENLKGIEFLDDLYQSIIKKETIKITYQSFKARSANTFDFHAFLLKEFRNRWFLIGSKHKGDAILNLALDRIVSIESSSKAYRTNPKFDADEYFKHAIGVSVSPTLEPEEVILFITHKHAPYALTKPFHPSQKQIGADYYGVTISLNVQLNFELEKEILGLGDGVRVVAPERLRKSIQNRLQGGLDLYRTELNKGSVENRVTQLQHKGSAILDNIYTKREVNKMGGVLNDYFKTQGKKRKQAFALRRLLLEVPKLKAHIFNQNLKTIIDAIDKNAFLTKAIYFNKAEGSNWSVTNHQDLAINVAKDKSTKKGDKVWKVKSDDYYGWTEKEEVVSVCPPAAIGENRFTIRIHLDDAHEKNGALKVIPGSHNKVLTDEEIRTITENSIPQVCSVLSGGVQLMKPLVLHASAKSKSDKKRRVIHLEFASMNLQKGLLWQEYQEIDFNEA